jgi:hypothetical protein
MQTQVSSTNINIRKMSFITTAPEHSSHPDSPETYEQDQCEEQNLADSLGRLSMNGAGTGMHLSHVSERLSLAVYNSLSNQQKKNKRFSRGAGIQGYRRGVLPPTLSSPDLKVRIPPELMPDDETTLHYFDMSLMNIHPYVPVINKALFLSTMAYRSRNNLAPHS